MKTPVSLYPHTLFPCCVLKVEINSRVQSVSACCHSVQKLLSSSMLSKNTKIRVYRTVVLPVVLYGCETWSLTLREE
jgi:hypothetical protein